MTHITRRKFLGAAGMGIAGSILLPKVGFASKASQDVRSLFMHNIHTGEYLKTPYFEDGQYIPEALEQINKFCRDWRSGDVTTMDPKLMDLIHKVYEQTGSSKPIELVSGYRCPKTNAKLCKKSKGVAKKSYHMKGMAADLYIPGVQLSNVRKLACAQGAGGVGYYPKSGFVHMDVRPGPKKRW